LKMNQVSRIDNVRPADERDWLNFMEH
jgi:hypothetical protein